MPYIRIPILCMAESEFLSNSPLDPVPFKKTLHPDLYNWNPQSNQRFSSLHVVESKISRRTKIELILCVVDFVIG